MVQLAVHVQIFKGKDRDTIGIDRPDLPLASFVFPHKGPIPHDAVHFFVEHSLGLGNGFWGKVASGADPEAIGQLAAAMGHASAKRAAKPDASIVELLQAERLVECFEAELWSNGSDNEALLSMASSGWERSLVPRLEIAPEALNQIRDCLARFSDEWQALAIGQSIKLVWTISDDASANYPTEKLAPIVPVTAPLP